MSPSKPRSFVACTCCRDARTKCDGGMPCQRCAHRRLECVRRNTTDQEREDYKQQRRRNTGLRSTEVTRDGDQVISPRTPSQRRSSRPTTSRTQFVDEEEDSELDSVDSDGDKSSFGEESEDDGNDFTPSDSSPGDGDLSMRSSLNNSAKNHEGGSSYDSDTSLDSLLAQASECESSLHSSVRSRASQTPSPCTPTFTIPPRSPPTARERALQYFEMLSPQVREELSRQILGGRPASVLLDDYVNEPIFDYIPFQSHRFVPSERPSRFTVFSSHGRSSAQENNPSVHFPQYTFQM